MKLNVKKITIVLLIGCLFLSASKPSIDGRALVANEGELPVGLFAKSGTYLPGDTVVVTNPATNISTEVMIFGSFDSSEGIAIILSPEAAKKLFIEKGSSSLVRITKSSIKDSEPQLFSESISNTKKTADPDKDPMLHIEDSVPYVEEAEKVESTPIEEVEEAKEVENTPIEEVEEAEEVESTPIEDNSQIVSTETEEIKTQEEEYIIEDKTSELSTVEDSPDKEELTSEKIMEKTEIAPTEEDATFYSPFADDTTIIAKEDLIKTIEEPITKETPEKFEQAEISTSEEKVTENIPQTIEPIVSPEPEVLEVTPTKEAIESETKNEPEITKPNTLVPSVLTPPESTVIVLDTSDQESEKGDKVEAEKIEKTMIDDPNAFLPAVEDKEEHIPEISTIEKPIVDKTVNIQDYIIDNETVLGTNNYYIQLATYKQMDNITDIINKYTEKYPIKLIKYDKLDAYRVILGPLNEDEYPIVLKRFVTYGFTDAFLRKIN